jgi:hypothetical protein
MPAQTKPLTSIYCPKCDRIEQGRTESRMLNLPGGYKCTGLGHPFKYLELMAMKPRMEKLVVQEKQPPSATVLPIWIHPDALAALQTRFPSNFKTTLYSLFSALADPATVLIEGEHCRELATLGIHKGKEIVGLARTNNALTEQLKAMQEQMKQYEMLSKLMALAQGGQANSPGAQSALVDQMLNPLPESAAAALPPRARVLPVIDPDSDTLYEPVAPGSFSAMT